MTSSPVNRQTVDLDAYPDLIVIVLGMRVNALTGFKSAFGLGPQINRSVASKPDGLLLHENLIFSLFPPHIGMRQYWRDYESLERYSRSEPHRTWWKKFLRSSSGTGFWHETYTRHGGFEAIYDDMKRPIGMMNFAPVIPAVGSSFASLRRHNAAGGGEGSTESNNDDNTP